MLTIWNSYDKGHYAECTTYMTTRRNRNSYRDTKQETKNGDADDDNLQLILWREDPRYNAVSLVLSGTFAFAHLERVAAPFLYMHFILRRKQRVCSKRTAVNSGTVGRLPIPAIKQRSFNWLNSVIIWRVLRTSIQKHIEEKKMARVLTIKRFCSTTFLTNQKARGLHGLSSEWLAELDLRVNNEWTRNALIYV